MPNNKLGKPLNWSNSDLETLSKVTELDQKAALRLWQNTAPKKYKRLLEAKRLKTA